MTDPQGYFDELQRIDREQGLTRLRTLALEFESTLARLPRLRQEIEGMLQPREGIDYGTLAERVELALTQATELLLELDMLPADVREADAIEAFGWALAATLTVRTVEGLARKLPQLCGEVRDAQSEAGRKAREAAERRKALRVEMVAVPAGRFTMGCVKGRDDVEGGPLSSEKPAHEVRVPGFALGKYPVTFAQFDIFCAETGFAKPSDAGWGRGNRPVIGVSWHDALSYCAWLREVTGEPYRLPSEAEWEYAARAGGNGAFPWGQRADPSQANFGGTVGRTTPVGEYPPNGFGLFDMHGNVWEWVQDPWHEDYQGAPTDGLVWPGGGSRVFRGGSWGGDAGDLRSALRLRNDPGLRYDVLGFRLALGQAGSGG